MRIAAADRKNLQEACLFALERSHLKVERSDATAGTIRTEWDEDLFPFYSPQGGGGVRKRAWVEINAGNPGAANGALAEHVVRVRVEQEKNAEKKHPGDRERADWQPMADDADLAHRIAVTVQTLVGDFRPSDDFYRRRGWEPPRTAGRP